LLYNAIAYINICFKTIFDARISFEIIEGYAITFEFAIADIVKRGEKL